MNFKKHLSHLLSLAILLSALSLTLTGCAQKDEWGRKYKEKDESTLAATEKLTEAVNATNSISDIQYDIALMVSCFAGSESYRLGIKNSYSATDRNTEQSNIYCHKTYFGTEGNDVAAYYRNNGYLYTMFCDTHVSAPMTENEFYEYVSSTPINADTDFFSTERFASGCLYTYGDGSCSAVFLDGNAELGKMIADFLGLTTYSYTYECTNIKMRCDIGTDGTVKECKLSFDMAYYKAASPDERINYEGDFKCTVNSTGDSVSVQAPTVGVKYEQISNFEHLSLLTNAYSTLAKQKSVAALYKRKVTNEDMKSLYSLETVATFTQALRGETYTYGSIDLEKGKTPTEETLSSVGIFLESDGMRYYRDFDGNDKDTKNESSTEEWLQTFSNTMLEEVFFEADICSLTFDESEEGFITFTYKYNTEMVRIYAQDVLSMPVGGTNISIEGQNVSAIKNQGKIKVRLSDGCLVYHEIDFSALIGYTVTVSSVFSLEITATGDSVDVLDRGDWRVHVNTNK